MRKLSKQKGSALLELFVPILLLAIFFVVFSVPFYFLMSKSCHAKAKSFESVEYSFFAGCMVTHEGRWLPLENIRGFD